MKKKAAEAKFPRHMSGKDCGYTLYEDGSIEIAPSYADIMSKAEAEAAGINALISALNTNLAKQYESVERAKQHFWKIMGEDYGLDFEKYNYSYNGYTKKVSRIEKGKPKEPE